MFQFIYCYHAYNTRLTMTRFKVTLQNRNINIEELMIEVEDMDLVHSTWIFLRSAVFNFLLMMHKV